MNRRLLVRSSLLAALALPLACAKPPQVEARALMSQLVTDPSGRAQVEVRYLPQAPDAVEIFLDVVGVGVDEMDKLAIDVEFDGFVLVDGTTQWAGFAPPRDHQKHRLLLRMLDDVDHGTINIVMTRFNDSELLWQQEASFRREGGTLVTP